MSTKQARACCSDVVTSEGVGTNWFVMLPDGYLMACGIGFAAKDRAEEVAERLNESYHIHRGTG